MTMAGKTFRAKILHEGPACTFELPFDPKAVFGQVRAPVKVTIKGYTFRTRVVAMGGPPCIAFRKDHREAAGVDGGDTVQVRVELDTEERVVTPPADLMKALKAAPPAWDRWQELSYTHQREHVEAIEEAKAADTRTRRIERAVRDVSARQPRKR
jgi:ribosomal protein L11